MAETVTWPDAVAAAAFFVMIAALGWAIAWGTTRPRPDELSERLRALRGMDDGEEP